MSGENPKNSLPSAFGKPQRSHAPVTAFLPDDVQKRVDSLQRKINENTRAADRKRIKESISDIISHHKHDVARKSALKEATGDFPILAGVIQEYQKKCASVFRGDRYTWDDRRAPHDQWLSEQMKPLIPDETKRNLCMEELVLQAERAYTKACLWRTV